MTQKVPLFDKLGTPICKGALVCLSTMNYKSAQLRYGYVQEVNERGFVSVLGGDIKRKIERSPHQIIVCSISKVEDDKTI